MSESFIHCNCEQCGALIRVNCSALAQKGIKIPASAIIPGVLCLECEQPVPDDLYMQNIVTIDANGGSRPAKEKALRKLRERQLLECKAIAAIAKATGGAQ